MIHSKYNSKLISKPATNQTSVKNKFFCNLNYKKNPLQNNIILTVCYFVLFVSCIDTYALINNR